MGESPLNARVRAVAADDTIPHSYFVFADGRLSRVGPGSTEAVLVAEVPDTRERGPGTGDGRLADRELELGIYVHGPWVCVTERFGVNASLINTVTGAVRGLSRADYHSDVSSYSIGFLDRDGRTLLVAQTQWNRLDVFDAETGANLTEREVFIRDSGRCDEDGSGTAPHVGRTNFSIYTDPPGSERGGAVQSNQLKSRSPSRLGWW
ncbi:hypothetical protein ACIA5A_19450 [Micromonospora sp. NPDC051300]|uniref:hypothetical protein n=1 Tax=Micromonospora sp. NPDC051300 TaxID=3364286 RepID=UPI0037A47AD0